jgi:hypothetical protein
MALHGSLPSVENLANTPAQLVLFASVVCMAVLFASASRSERIRAIIDQNAVSHEQDMRRDAISCSRI